MLLLDVVDGVLVNADTTLLTLTFADKFRIAICLPIGPVELG